MATDDLRYPSVAEKYKELVRSKLPVNRGSMPGKPLQKVEEDKLISGRGVIP